jgi:FkbM family methyltransferase
MPIFPVTATVPGRPTIRAKIACSERDPLVRAFTARPGHFYEEDLLLALAREYDGKGWKGGAILDVGSHVGNHSAFLAHLGPVYAFEADPRCQAAWLRTMALTCPPNPAVLVPAPVWSEARRMDISRNRTGRAHAVETDRGTMSVTLDGVASGLSVSIIKMDIEGGERHALRGATRLLTTFTGPRPVLAIECKSPDALVRVEAELHDIGAVYERGERYCATPTYLFRPV